MLATQSGRKPQASSQLHFVKGLWSYVPLDWKPDLKGSQDLPAGNCSDICGQSTASSVFSPAHKSCFTLRKQAFLLTAVLSNPRCASGLAGLWRRQMVAKSTISSLKPCRMKALSPLPTFFQARIRITEILSTVSLGHNIPTP